MILKLSTWWKEEDKTPLIIQQQCLLFHMRKIPLQQTARGSQIAFVLDQWNIVIKNIFLAMITWIWRWNIADVIERTMVVVAHRATCEKFFVHVLKGRPFTWAHSLGSGSRLALSSICPLSQATTYNLLQRPWLHKIVLFRPVCKLILWNIFP